MPRAFRPKVVVLSLLMTSGALSMQSCAKKQTPSTQSDPHADPRYVAATQSLAQLKTDGQRLQADTAAIHKRFDQVSAVAEDLAGLAAFRGNLFATEEILGGVGNTIDWLQTEREAAFASGDRQRIEKVTATIASSAEELKKFEESVIGLSHQLMPFERTVAQFKALAAAGVFFTQTLRTGIEVRGANGGLEQRLLRELEAGKKVSRASWLDLDRVWFEGDTATLDNGASSEQLDNLSDVLKAYPDARVELAGYGDTASSADAPKDLAGARAVAVKARLVSLGIAEARLKVGASGRARPPCVGKDVERCRAERPRVALRLTAS